MTLTFFTFFFLLTFPWQPNGPKRFANFLKCYAPWAKKKKTRRRNDTPPLRQRNFFALVHVAKQALIA